jgi:hypothetical protein
MYIILNFNRKSVNKLFLIEWCALNGRYSFIQFTFNVNKRGILIIPGLDEVRSYAFGIFKPINVFNNFTRIVGDFDK